MIELAEMVKKVVNPKAEVRAPWCSMLCSRQAQGGKAVSLPVPAGDIAQHSPGRSGQPLLLPLLFPALQLVFVENTADDPSRRKPDITKAKTLLGWQPKVGQGWVGIEHSTGGCGSRPRTTGAVAGSCKCGQLCSVASADNNQPSVVLLSLLQIKLEEGLKMMVDDFRR